MRTIVLTRPLPCADTLHTQLMQMGLHVYHLPTLSLSAFQDDGAEARIRKHWPNYTVTMFVSQHAAAFAHQHMTRLGLTWPADIRFATVGQGTVDALRQLWPAHQLFIQPASADTQDSEGLWRAIGAHPELQSPQNLLLIRAEQGRDLLLQLTQQAHWHSDIWPCYRRAPRHWNDDELAQFAHACAQKAMLVITSIEGLSALIEQLSPELHHTAQQQRVVAIHPRIAQFAQASGFSDVHVCLPSQLAEQLPQLAHIDR